MFLQGGRELHRKPGLYFVEWEFEAENRSSLLYPLTEYSLTICTPNQVHAEEVRNKPASIWNARNELGSTQKRATKKTLTRREVIQGD